MYEEQFFQNSYKKLKNSINKYGENIFPSQDQYGLQIHGTDESRLSISRYIYIYNK